MGEGDREKKGSGDRHTNEWGREKKWKNGKLEKDNVFLVRGSMKKGVPQGRTKKRVRNTSPHVKKKSRKPRGTYNRGKKTSEKGGEAKGALHQR